MGRYGINKQERLVTNKGNVIGYRLHTTQGIFDLSTEFGCYLNDNLTSGDVEMRLKGENWVSKTEIVDKTTIKTITDKLDEDLVNMNIFTKEYIQKVVYSEYKDKIIEEDDKHIVIKLDDNNIRHINYLETFSLEDFKDKFIVDFSEMKSNKDVDGNNLISFLYNNIDRNFLMCLNKVLSYCEGVSYDEDGSYEVGGIYHKVVEHLESLNTTFEDVKYPNNYGYFFINTGFVPNESKVSYVIGILNRFCSFESNHLLYEKSDSDKLYDYTQRININSKQQRLKELEKEKKEIEENIKRLDGNVKNYEEYEEQSYYRYCLDSITSEFNHINSFSSDNEYALKAFIGNV